MKKLILAVAMVAFTGGIASKVYASSTGTKMEVRDDEKKKKRKKKKACCAAEQKKCCSTGTQKTGCSGEKH